MQLSWLPILIVVLFVYFTKTKRFSVAAFFYVLPFFAELLEFEVGLITVPLWTFLSLLIVLTSYKSDFFTLHNKLLLSISKPLMLFLVISIVVFAFVGPVLLFSSFPEGDTRAWSQKYIGRACISSIRFLLQLSSIYATFIVFSRTAPKDPTHVLSAVGVTSAFYGLLNLVSHGFLNAMLFPESRLELSDRLISMNGEPRVFGQSMAVIAMIFFIDFFHEDSRKSLRSLILFCVFSLFVFASTSATSTAILGAGVTLIVLTNVKSKKINKISQLILILFIFTPVVLYLFTNLLDSLLNEQMSGKLLSVFTGEERYDPTGLATDNDAFDFFKRLEVFDRAAMNFITYNPVFLFTGVGPNTVSIPASSYIDSYSATIYKDGIDSVPHKSNKNKGEKLKTSENKIK